MTQMFLPRVMDNEEPGALLDEDLVEFAVRIKQGLEEAREIQRDAEASIRKNMKKFGDEKRFVVNTPPVEIVKGFPEIELKWMFGDKEVVVPKATNVHLYHGWKKWREEVKADLKKSLLEDVDFGKQYMTQRQVEFAYITCYLHKFVYFVCYKRAKARYTGTYLHNQVCDNI